MICLFPAVIGPGTGMPTAGKPSAARSDRINATPGMSRVTLRRVAAARLKKSAPRPPVSRAATGSAMPYPLSF